MSDPINTNEKKWSDATSGGFAVRGVTWGVTCFTGEIGPRPSKHSDAGWFPAFWDKDGYFADPEHKTLFDLIEVTQ